MISLKNIDLKGEIIGGITTFLSMAYIIIVNPKILEIAGIPFEGAMIATILTASIFTILMGLYTDRPFAIAPYMGENAFIAYTVVKGLGYSWQTALGAIFISGILFVLITLSGIRKKLAEDIPPSLKIAFAVGIGLFLTFIGLNDIGIVKLGVEGAPVHIGNLRDIKVLLGIFSFFLMVFLLIKRIKGFILISIITTTILAILFGLIPIPKDFISFNFDLSSTFLKLDIKGALTWGFVSIILTIFIMDFVDTMGTLIALGYQANLVDEKGNLPEIEKPMLVDAIATVFGAILGTTTSGVFIESATGIKEGARKGLSSIVVGFLFLISIFFTPLYKIVPSFSYGPALVVVGMFMFENIRHFKFSDYSETIPSFITIILMSFTYNIGIGMTAGFLTYIIIKLFSGKIRDITPTMWFLGFLSLIFYVFYPY